MRLSASTPGTVLTPEGCGPVVEYAADQLAYYLALVTGGWAARLRYSRGEPAPPADGLVLRLALADGPAAGVAAEQATLTVDRGTAELSSPTPRGLLHGVYRLLARFAGIHWLNLLEGEEHVPRLEAVEIPEGRYWWRPRFDLRAFTNYPRIDAATADFADWMARRGFSHYCVNPQWPGAWEAYRAHLAEPLSARGLTASLDHHTLPFWLPPEELFGEHPEYFALTGGRRSADGQPCTGDPAVRRLIARRILGFLAENADVAEIGLWPRDGYGWCECDLCSEGEEPRPSWWSPDLPNRTDAYLRFVNAVAEEVGAERPDVILTALAYVNYVEPPERARPLPNVAIYFAAFQRCLKHPLGAPECRRRNAEYAEFLKAWRDATSGPLRMFLYDLQIDTLSMPYRSLDRILADLDLMESLGVDGYVLEYVPEEWCAFASNAHLIAEASWAGDTGPLPPDAEDVLAGHTAALYGGAAELMTAHFRELTARLVADGPCTGHYDRTYTTAATAASLRPAFAYLGRALAVASGDKRAWKAVRRAQASANLLLKVGEWQRRFLEVQGAARSGRALLAPRLRAAADDVVASAGPAAELGVADADKLRPAVTGDTDWVLAAG